MTYPADRLFEEVGYVAYHFHWPLDDLLDLEHTVRHRFVEEIARINGRMAEATSPAPEAPSALPEGTFRAGHWSPS